jgi:tRNA/tmRNA/rRNA uracil-C5-methylase (TrmA/RlmC/RlmD family)
VERCKHFGVCGGCATQDVPYADEVRRKEAALAERFGRAVTVAPSPRELHYRTRMDYVYAFHKLGLRKKGDPKGVIDLEECLLISPRAFEAVRRARDAVKRAGLEPYSFVSNKGYLRYVIVREAPVAGELMLILLCRLDVHRSARGHQLRRRRRGPQARLDRGGDRRAPPAVRAELVLPG